MAMKLSSKFERMKLKPSQAMTNKPVYNKPDNKPVYEKPASQAASTRQANMSMDMDKTKLARQQALKKMAGR